MNDAKPDVASLPAKLLPCPFCGGTPSTEAPMNQRPLVSIHCSECDVSCMTEYVTQDEAIAAWNRRALTPTGEGGLPADDRRHVERAIRVLRRDYESPLAFDLLNTFAQSNQLNDKDKKACDQMDALDSKWYSDWCERDGSMEELYAELATTEQPGSSVQGEVRLFDGQWVNIVNHANCWEGYSKEDAIAEAVRMTEAKIAENVAMGKLPQPRTTPPPAPAAEQGES
jgi:Lar family restriction alleviation protein